VPGGWRLGNRPFGCWKEGHGQLSVVEAIEQSCDVFFYQVGTRVGLGPLHDLAEGMGVSGPTRIPLPHEKPGEFPDAEWYDERLGPGRWAEASVSVNLAIGQGEVLATPLQVAVMTASVANGGRRVTPYLGRYTIPGDGSPPRPIPHRGPEPIEGISEEHMALVQEGMVRVVNGEAGTARHLAWRLPGVIVAGKSGTGQNPHGEDHAWFTAYAPAQAPEIAVTVLVENGGGGSAVAAPIAFDVLRTYFQGRGETDGRSVGGRQQ
jgi:penicillin-binding protein 2